MFQHFDSSCNGDHLPLHRLTPQFPCAQCASVSLRATLPCRFWQTDGRPATPLSLPPVPTLRP